VSINPGITTAFDASMTRASAAMSGRILVEREHVTVLDQQTIRRIGRAGVTGRGGHGGCSGKQTGAAGTQEIGTRKSVAHRSYDGV
jgi:hypothetical protein